MIRKSEMCPNQNENEVKILSIATVIHMVSIKKRNHTEFMWMKFIACITFTKHRISLRPILWFLILILGVDRKDDIFTENKHLTSVTVFPIRIKISQHH